MSLSLNQAYGYSVESNFTIITLTRNETEQNKSWHLSFLSRDASWPVELRQRFASIPLILDSLSNHALLCCVKAVISSEVSSSQLPFKTWTWLPVLHLLLLSETVTSPLVTQVVTMC